MKLIILIIFSSYLYSYPSKLDVYFYTTKDKVSFNDELASQKIATNTLKLQCQKMGEYCFDPQIGLYEKGDADKIIKLDDYKSEKKVNGLGAKGIFNQGYIKCDKNKFYDVFCGKKEKAITKKIMFDVWIDTSKIMKNKDYDFLKRECKRKNFFSLLESSCGIKKGFKLFGLSRILKPLGSLEQSCQSNASLVDINKLISWIEKSDSKNLQIFLDEYYAKGKFLSFLKTRSNTKVYGIEKSIHLSDMDEELIKLKKYCR